MPDAVHHAARAAQGGRADSARPAAAQRSGASRGCGRAAAKYSILVVERACGARTLATTAQNLQAALAEEKAAGRSLCLERRHAPRAPRPAFACMLVLAPAGPARVCRVNLPCDGRGLGGRSSAGAVRAQRVLHTLRRVSLFSGECTRNRRKCALNFFQGLASSGSRARSGARVASETDAAPRRQAATRTPRKTSARRRADGNPVGLERTGHPRVLAPCAAHAVCSKT